MLSYNELKPGIAFVKDGQPYTVLDYQHVKKQRGKPVVQLTIKNMLTGKTQEYTARQSDSFEAAEVEKQPAAFIYEHRGEFWFRDPHNPSDRFSVSEEAVGESAGYLTEELEVEIIRFKGDVIDVALPPKVDLRVTQAPPNIRGNTADSGGTKLVTTETGLTVNTPLFIERGDIIRINTETGEYSERVEKR